MAPNDPDLPRDDSIPEPMHEFITRFSDEAECERVLRKWKYGGHFRCPEPGCDSESAIPIATRNLDQCSRCGKQVSLKSGTVMHASDKPLSLWFFALYYFVESKQGISAMELKRRLGVSYPTAWAWLHKMRSAVGQRSIEMLEGIVEADETWEGGLAKGSPGRPSAGGKKALIAAAIEHGPTGYGLGRLRLARLVDGSAASLKSFLENNVSPGTTLLTDDWRSYRKPAADLGYQHEAVNVSKSQAKAHEVLPGVHRVFSLLHRVLAGTYQGAVSHAHLPAYLAEYEFRFNRRNSASRALLFQRALSFATMQRPPTYHQLRRCRGPKIAAEVS